MCITQVKRTFGEIKKDGIKERKHTYVHILDHKSHIRSKIREICELWSHWYYQIFENKATYVVFTKKLIGSSLDLFNPPILCKESLVFTANALPKKKKFNIVHVLKLCHKNSSFFAWTQSYIDYSSCLAHNNLCYI